MSDRKTSAAVVAKAAAVGGAFLAVFGPTLLKLSRDWLQVEDYRHGLLLVPIAGYLAWKRRTDEGSPDRAAGIALLVGSLVLFLLGTVMVELFTRRLALIGALAGLVLFYSGRRQLKAWWLSFALVLFTIPLPSVVLDTLTLPLQLFASEAAVQMLELRHVPVRLAGNVILLPDQRLFVAEACSGLRSLSALFGLTLLFGGTGLKKPFSRGVLLVLALPAAIAANVLRVFVTGYFGYYAGPGFVEGATHQAAGIAVFGLALGLVLAGMRGLRVWEQRLTARQVRR